MTLSINKTKFIRSLWQKKFRDEHGLFVAEGEKLVGELLPVFSCRLLVAQKKWLEGHRNFTADEIIEVNESGMDKITQLKSPPTVLALFAKPDYPTKISFENKLTLALDDIQDPGNVGAILRIADWFGIEQALCSEATADVFNSKTIQATMGAIARVRTQVVNLPKLLSELPKEIPVYGTFLEGQSVYQAKLADTGIIVMGNEGKGISDNVAQFVSEKLFIPNFPPHRKSSESLNVAAAAAIICSEFRRHEINNL